MKTNMNLYNAIREVPKSAQKDFNNGRFRGTDINPMWRIKTLTEQFGPCGVGWYYEPIRCWSETVGLTDVCVFAEINLYIKYDGEWSKPIYGIGGSKMLTEEKKGLYVNDEAYKMATTDAISVACKSLGMGADIYWQNDNTKYSDAKRGNVIPADPPQTVNKDQVDALMSLAAEKNVPINAICDRFGVTTLVDLTVSQYDAATRQLNMTEKK